MTPATHAAMRRVLSLLLDTPYSFAGLYRSLVVNFAWTASVDELFNFLQELEQENLIKIRTMDMEADGELADAPYDERMRARSRYRAWLSTNVEQVDASIDEVGIWLELTREGRRVAQEGHGSTDNWRLDDYATERIVTVHATSLDLADEVLDQWREEHPALSVIEKSRRIEQDVTFQMPDESIVRDGVRLTYEYDCEARSSTRAG